MTLRPLIIIGLACVTYVSANAQTQPELQISGNASKEQTKELVLHFRFDRSLVDSGYRDNHTTLIALHELFSDHRICSSIDSIRIQAYSSPEGNATYNLRLARRRAHAVKGYLVWKYPDINQYRIRTSAQAENWKAIRNIVEKDPDVPCKDEVLQILTLDRSNERIGALLKKLNSGIPYRYISDNILPDLRNASICTLYMRFLKHPSAQEQLVPMLTSNSDSSLSFRAERRLYPNLIIKRGFERKLIPSLVYTKERDSSASPGMKRVPLLAVKTNLLFDAALMPNVEIEVPLGKRWSLNGEYMFPWWQLDGDKYCLEILSGGVEGRYWLGKRDSREVLTGHFLGLYAGGGKYDLQWKENGYQGEFFIAAGLSYGYARSIAKNLHLEFSLGIGLMRTNYRHYHAKDNYQTLLWQENGNYTWAGPTKVKLSLVWMLTKRNRNNH